MEVLMGISSIVYRGEILQLGMELIAGGSVCVELATQFPQLFEGSVLILRYFRGDKRVISTI